MVPETLYLGRMTPIELKNSSTIDLVIAFKNKARCFHSRRKSDAIIAELRKRIPHELLTSVEIEAEHLKRERDTGIFSDECDKLIEKIKSNQ